MQVIRLAGVFVLMLSYYEGIYSASQKCFTICKAQFVTSKMYQVVIFRMLQNFNIYESSLRERSAQEALEDYRTKDKLRLILTKLLSAYDSNLLLHNS